MKFAMPALRQIVGAVLVATSCSSAVASASDTKMITAVMHADLRSLDPVITTGYIVRNFGYMVYDTLVAADANGNLKPQMLKDWQVSKDGKTYTFTLREGLKWHDGAPVTSEDCLASIERWAKLDKMGQVMNSLLESSKVLDAKSFSMTFSEPTDLILRSMGKPSAAPAFMMPKRLASTPTTTAIREAVGSGPFRFVSAEYRPGVQAMFEKNKDYVPRTEAASGFAGGKVVHVERVKWVTMPDTMTAINALNNQEVDFLENVSHDLLPLLERNPKVLIAERPYQGGQLEMRMNFMHPPFNNKKIRQAALLAIDQEAVMQSQSGNPKYYKTCAAVFGCGTPYASSKGSEKLLKANAAGARKLLQEGGYDGTPVIILHPADLASVAATPPVLAQQLRNAGFKVDLQSMDWQTLLTRRASREVPAKGGWNLFATLTVLPDIYDPLRFMGVAANGADAWFGWPDVPSIEERRARFARSSDAGELKKLAAEIHDLVLDEAVIVPLGEISRVSAMSKGLSDVLNGQVPVFWNVKKN